jgi:sulfide:quinone oxidoreductase
MPSRTDLDEAARGVLVAGAGVAALETIVALRKLAPAAVAPTLVAPDETFSLRALSVFEPFGHEPAPRYPLAALTAALDVGRRRDAIEAVDRERRVVRLRSGATMAYDVLVLAVGAIAYPVFDHGILFDYARNPEPFDRLLSDIRSGHVDSVIVVVPRACAWTLPAYELAFMLAAFARGEAVPSGAAGRARHLDVTVVTAESAPLAAFGPAAADMIHTEFAATGIGLVSDARAQVPSDRYAELPHGRRLMASRIVHLPGTTGPRIAGVPYDPDGFIPVGADLHVGDDPDVFAIGDATVGAHKHGGLAAQQGDAVARAIAHSTDPTATPPQPYRPVLRAVLRTGRGPRYLRAEPPGGHGECLVSDQCLWWPPSKVASRWLGPWLAARDLAAGHINRGARI